MIQQLSFLSGRPRYTETLQYWELEQEKLPPNTLLLYHSCFFYLVVYIRVIKRSTTLVALSGSQQGHPACRIPGACSRLYKLAMALLLLVLPFRILLDAATTALVMARDGGRVERMDIGVEEEDEEGRSTSGGVLLTEGKKEQVIVGIKRRMNPMVNPD
jgi:hypothetical protein